MVLLGRLSPKTIGFTHEWTRTNRVNFMKIGSKLRPAYRNFLYINKYVSILTLRICNQGPSKRKTWPPHLPHLISFEVEGVRIVVISFRNIVKNPGNGKKWIRYGVNVSPNRFLRFFTCLFGKRTSKLYYFCCEAPVPAKNSRTCLLKGVFAVYSKNNVSFSRRKKGLINKKIFQRVICDKKDHTVIFVVIKLLPLKNSTLPPKKVFCGFYCGLSLK